MGSYFIRIMDLWLSVVILWLYCGYTVVIL